MQAWVKSHPPLPDGRESRELLNELIGHHLAQAWGLPQPRLAGLINLPRAKCPDLPVWNHYSPDVSSLLSWWTLHVEAKTVSASYHLQTLADGTDNAKFRKAFEHVRDQLRAASAIPPIVAFDEVIANIDRNPGNLLGPVASRYLLIDHGRCLTGPDWRAARLDPAAHYCNVLRDILDWNMAPIAAKSRAVASIDHWSRKLPRTLTGVRSLLAGILEPSEIDAIVHFIAERARRDTAAQRMGLIA